MLVMEFMESFDVEIGLVWVIFMLINLGISAYERPYQRFKCQIT